MGTNELIALVVGLIVLVLGWKLFKATLKAVVLATVVAAVIYVSLPYLSGVDGPVGDGAKAAQEKLEKR